jgi:hypothetical protein
MGNDKLLVIKVYVEAIALLRTFYCLKMNMQLLKYLGFYNGNERSKYGLAKP